MNFERAKKTSSKNTTGVYTLSLLCRYDEIISPVMNCTICMKVILFLLSRLASQAMEEEEEGSTDEL